MKDYTRQTSHFSVRIPLLILTLILSILVFSSSSESAFQRKKFNTKVEYGQNGTCGFSNSGKDAYLYHQIQDKKYKVTVAVTHEMNGKKSTINRTFKVLSKTKKSMGCTKGNSIGSGSYSFRIIAEEEY